MNTTHPNITVSRTFTVPHSWGYGSDRKIKVTAAAHNPCRNATPSFSVTAEIFKPGAGDCEACRCLHRESLKMWPAIRSIVDLHLSCAVTGEPMHGEANGFYWLAGACGGLGARYHGGSSEMQHWKDDGTFDRYGKSTEAECLKIFMEHCRCGESEAEEIREAVREAYQKGRDSVAVSEEVTEACAKAQAKAGNAAAKEVWRTLCDAMRPRWQAEALAGVALLESLQRPDGEAMPRTAHDVIV